MRKVAGYEYPYKVWPDDYPHESLYPDSEVEKIAAKHGLPTDNKSIKEFQRVLIRAARDFFGREKFYGQNAVTDSDIFRSAGSLLSAAKGIINRLEPDKLSVEMFEVLVDAWADVHGDGSPNEVPSFYSEYRFREDSPLQTPTITSFYKGHSGYKKFNEFRERLLPLLDELAAVANTILEDDSKFYYGAQKSTGERQNALNNYVKEMRLFWERYTGEKSTAYIDIHDDYQSVCGDFVAACLKPVISHMDVQDSSSERINDLDVNLHKRICSILIPKKRSQKKSQKARKS
jgi:hypothetical protein